MSAVELSCLVVDDEPLAAERLAGMIGAIQNCKVVGMAGNAEQAFAQIVNLRPDLVLLDITMPGENGLDLAKRLQNTEHPPAVVFCTAYDAHALQAFEAQAIDYLLKPVRAERLAESIERVRRLKPISGPQINDMPAFVAASVGGVIRRIDVEDIYYLQADDKYTVAHHRGGEHVLDSSLKELEAQFNGRLLRIHRNCLVNPSQLTELRRDHDGHVWAILKSVDKPLEVSRRCAGDLKDWFKGT